MLVLPIVAMVRRMVIVFAWVPVGWVAGLCGWHCTQTSGGPFDQLVEFTPIKPNAPALRTVVNFNVLAFGHQEIRIRADRAFHGVLSVKVGPPARVASLATCKSMAHVLRDSYCAC